MQAVTNPSLLKHNPVYRAEYHHQQYIIENGRTGTLWIVLALALVIPSLLGSLVQIIVTFLSPFMDPQLVNDIFNFGDGAVTIILIITNVAMYSVVMLITQALASNSISRERRGHTWDNLRLTHIGSEKIIMGKWWASLRALRGDHVMTTVIRIGLVMPIIVIFKDSIQTPLGIPAPLVHGTIFIIASILYSVLDAMLAAAMGMVAAASERWNSILSVVMLCLRGVFSLGAVFWMVWCMWGMVYWDMFVYLIPLILGLLIYLLAIAVSLYGAHRLVE